MLISALRTVVLLIFLPFLTFAQTKNKNLARGDKYYKALQYKLAIPYYLKAVKEDSLDLHTIEKLADSYRKVKDYPSALRWYAELIKRQPDNSEAILPYAEALANNQKYQEASKWYNKYNELKPEDLRGRLFASIYNKVNNFYADSSNWEVRYLNLNSVRADFSPVFFKGGLIFTSNRNPGSTTKRVFGWDGSPFTDIYRVSDTNLIKVSEISNIPSPNIKNRAYKLNPDDTPFSSNDSKTLGNISEIRLKGDEKQGDYSLAIKVSGLNSKYHDGPISFAENDSWGMFSRNGSKRSKKGQVNRVKLFSAKYAGGEWFDVKSFQYNSDNYSCGHPALSSDGKHLYFISDMPGGKGGTDIYYCSREGDGWTKPVNLGPSVNTEGNEMFPYVDNLGNLYFASTGLPGLGGLDVFRITLEDNLPNGDPENLGYPFNSSGDDFGILWSPGYRSGYFSSNRGGNDDIFKFNYVDRNLYLNGFTFVNSAGTKHGLNDVSIAVTGNLSSDTLKSDSKGAFNVVLKPEKEYQIQAFKKGYSAKSTILSTRGVKEKKLTAEIELAEIDSSKSEVTLAEIPTIDANFKNIYYGFDKYSIEKSQKPVLDSLASYLMSNSEAAIVATSHTDSRGAVTYNALLSKKRSASVKAYLMSKGVPASRIIIEFKGESELANRCRNGVPCLEKDQRLNRRTEFVIIPKRTY